MSQFVGFSCDFAMSDRIGGNTWEFCEWGCGLLVEDFIKDWRYLQN